MLFLLELLYTYFIFYLQHLFQHTYFTGLVLWHNRVLVHASGNANENGASHREPVTHVGDAEEAPGSDKPSHGSWGHSSSEPAEERSFCVIQSGSFLPLLMSFLGLSPVFYRASSWATCCGNSFPSFTGHAPCIHTHTFPLNLSHL